MNCMLKDIIFLIKVIQRIAHKQFFLLFYLFIHPIVLFFQVLNMHLVQSKRKRILSFDILVAYQIMKYKQRFID